MFSVEVSWITQVNQLTCTNQRLKLCIVYDFRCTTNTKIVVSHPSQHRHQRGMKELYKKRKETIERLFGTAKEYHNLRYTREKGKSKMEDKVGLTLACLNLKKLVKMRGETFLFCSNDHYSIKRWNISLTKRKRQTPFGMFVFDLRG